jgi:hypothetical protein
MFRVRRLYRQLVVAGIAYVILWASTCALVRPILWPDWLQMRSLQAENHFEHCLPLWTTGDHDHPGGWYIGFGPPTFTIALAHDRVWWRGYGNPTHPDDWHIGSVWLIGYICETHQAWTFERLVLPLWPVPFLAGWASIRNLIGPHKTLLRLRRMRRRKGNPRCPECGHPQPLQ